MAQARDSVGSAFSAAGARQSWEQPETGETTHDSSEEVGSCEIQRNLHIYAAIVIVIIITNSVIVHIVISIIKYLFDISFNIVFI